MSCFAQMSRQTQTFRCFDDAGGKSVPREALFLVSLGKPNAIPKGWQVCILRVDRSVPLG